ncbi:MAG: hypothetical protein U0790_21455 [Isosphaeraceae bacterium]
MALGPAAALAEGPPGRASSPAENRPAAALASADDREPGSTSRRPSAAPVGPAGLGTRALAGPLPRTTAAMLELDWLHRATNPIGPMLRAAMRWVAADANRCAYSLAAAEFDLRRAGADDRWLEDLKAGPDRWPAGDRPALAFARQMTVNAKAVTDAQVAALREAYGEEKLVAMVLLLAHANFQDGSSCRWASSPRRAVRSRRSTAGSPARR